MSIRSVDRAISVLDCFDARQPLLSLHEISLKLGLPKTTAFRILQTLVDSGYILQTNDNQFELSMKILRLVECVRIDADMTRLARLELEKVAAETNETVALSGLVDNERVVIDLVECSLPLKLVIRRGERNDRHTGATGRVFLAYDPEYAKAYLKKKKEAPRIRDEIAKVLEDGYAVTTDFRVKGSAGVAVPIFDLKDRCLHSLGVYGPATRIIPNAESIGAILIKSANLISARAGSRRSIVVSR